MDNPDPTLSGLAQRLNRLESANQQLRRTLTTVVVLGTLTGVGACTLLNQETAGRIEAEEFVLVDPEHRTRGRFFIDDEGSTNLTLLDADGLVRAELRQSHFTDRGVILALYEENGEIGAELQQDDLILRKFDEYGTRMEASMGFGGWGGGPGLGLDTDSRNLQSAALFMSGGPEPNLHIRDTNGYQTFIGVTQFHNPETRLSTTTSAATILLYDGDELKWTSP